MIAKCFRVFHIEYNTKFQCSQLKWSVNLFLLYIVELMPQGSIACRVEFEIHSKGGKDTLVKEFIIMQAKHEKQQ